MNKKQLIVVWGLFILFAFCLSGCAVGNPNVGTYNSNGNISGFWAGVRHGIIAPITLFISFFNREMNIYEVFNTGFGYNAGFLIGVSLFIIGCRSIIK
jgi:hypothetical protein